jgi:hypothetical protein
MQEYTKMMLVVGNKMQYVVGRLNITHPASIAFLIAVQTQF